MNVSIEVVEEIFLHNNESYYLRLNIILLSWFLEGVTSTNGLPDEESLNLGIFIGAMNDDTFALEWNSHNKKRKRKKSMRCKCREGVTYL